MTSTNGLREVAARTWAFALMGGAAFWALRLLVGWGMVSWACSAGGVGRAALLGVSLVCLTGTGLALVISLRLWRLSTENDAARAAAGFVGLVGVMLNVLSLVLIVFESTPIVFIDPCRYPVL